MPQAEIFQAPGQNQLLSLLPANEAERLIARMERHSVNAHDVAIRPRRPIQRVYFPLSAVMSVLNPYDEDTMVEVATVGNEGMIGWPIFLGEDSMKEEVIGQIPGEALIMSAADFREEVAKDGPLRRVMGRYVVALISQVAQSVGCNVRHSIEERCARWLLMTHDRVGRDQFPLTHEFLAMMLGVRRPGVTIAAGALQRAGLIAYHRGQITILDREGLEQMSCECYRTTRDEFDRLMGIRDGNDDPSHPSPR